MSSLLLSLLASHLAMSVGEDYQGIWEQGGSRNGGPYDTVYHTKRTVVFLQHFIDSHAINTAGVHSHPFQQISILIPQLL